MLAYLAKIVAPTERLRLLRRLYAALYSIYRTRGPLNFPFICIIRVPALVWDRCIYSRGAFAEIQATGLMCISEVNRDLGISTRALFPRERRHCFMISPVKGQDEYRRTEDPHLAPGEAREVSKCPAKIAMAECFRYHRATR